MTVKDVLNRVKCDDGMQFKDATKLFHYQNNLQQHIPLPITKADLGHVTFHSKTKFNLMQLVGHGKINYIKELPEYQRVLNDSPK